MSEFSHVHGHSYHSNWNGPDALSSPEALVKRAQEIGLESICITDHASLSGVPDFAKAAAEAGIKPVVGTELYVCSDPAWRPQKETEDGAASEEGRGRRDYNHLIAIAHNWDGFIELCGLLSKAHDAPNFYRRARNAITDIYDTKHLTFSTACAGGILKRGDADCVVKEMLDALGRDRLFLEIQPHNDQGQIIVNKKAVELRDKLGMKLVAAQDFHYANPSDNGVHEVMLAVGSHDVMSNPNRWRYPVDDLYIKNKAEMVRAFTPWVRGGLLTPAMLAESFASADNIVASTDFKWTDMPVSLPQMATDEKAAVLQIAVTALKARNLASRPEYISRLKYEMEVLIEAGILNYFLILHDIVKWSRENNIMVGPGRGSAGGSLVAYLLGITTIDPIVHGLLFERFYRPGRLDLPDIDTDFEDERRGDVLAYIERRYGKDNVAMVASYTKLKPKGAIKDVARVYEIGHMEANDVTKSIAVVDIQVDDEDAEAKHADEVLADPAVAAFFARYPVVEKPVRGMVGCMRGTGQHAAGVVIAGVPVAQRAAVMRKDDRRVVCWDKWTVEKMGLMKLDILGLRTMTILRHAAENVWAMRGRKIVYEDIPLDDAKTLALFDAGNTTGVFQCESRGMREVFKGCRVDKFGIVADIISLYRPGPMESIPRYQSAQTGASVPTYLHPLLEPILSPTFGQIIYQEQMMQVFSAVGGFSPAEADKMRKICGKKLGPDEFNKYAPPFIDGAVKKGVSEDVAREIFRTMSDFGIYSFNKSHAYAYAMIAFWTAYMKANYPAEFWAAHLSSTGNEEKLAMAVDDVIKDRISILPPDVNVSDAYKFVPVTEASIMAPLTSIKGIGEKQANMIVGARKGLIDQNGLSAGETRTEAKRVVEFDGTRCRAGSFTDEADFLTRVYARVVNSRVRGSLSLSGAMPWIQHDPDVLRQNRIDLIGSIMKEMIVVDLDAEMEFDESVKSKIARYMTDLNRLGKETYMPQVMPHAGAKPRIMVVLSTPEIKDERKGSLCNGDGWAIFYNAMREKLKVAPKDFYVTALYKCRKPPVGYTKWAEDYQTILEQEIDALKPPLIIALGADAVAYFGGKGSRASSLYGKVATYKRHPIVYGISPIREITENMTGAMNELSDLIAGIVV